jgi:hypothetical protein
MSYNLAEAAATILRTIKGGNSAAAKRELGDRRVEPAEPHREHPAMGERSIGGDPAQRHAAPQAADLEAEIEALIGKAGDRLRQQLDEVHHGRDAGRDQARLPPDPRERRRWWLRISR